MKNKIKKRRKYHKDYSILIVKPHNIECRTNEWTSQFIMQAFERGTAEYFGSPTKMPEFGRNTGIKKFLTDPKHKDKTHIFFIDDDSPPIEPYAIELLRSLNKPVVAGVTPIIRVTPDNLTCHWSAIIQKDGKMQNIAPDELPAKPFKAHRVGGTCLLVERKVLEKLEPPCQKTTFNNECTNVTLSEDVYFSDKIRKAGFDIWVDPKIQCHHYHEFDMLDIFAVIRQTKETNLSKNA